MSRFPIHTLDSAPAPSKPLLHALAQAVGMVPNLAAGMAESPSLLEAFLSIRRIYERGTFSGAEVQVLSLTAAYENDCTFCMAFHSRMARKEGVSVGIVDALRAGRSPDDPRLGPLSDLAREMVRGRGSIDDAVLQRFLGAGYTHAQALEVVLGMAFSLMANYAGHLVSPALDRPLEPFAWQRAAPDPDRIEPELAAS